MTFPNSSAKERFFFYNSLTCLVKSLEGKHTTIDLRNDSFVNGFVSSVDGYMNITMDDALFTDPRGNQYYFESLFVQARKIRYVHIPETMPIVSTIKNQFAPRERKPKVDNKKNTFKVKRALQRHLETVATLGECSHQEEADEPSTFST